MSTLKLLLIGLASRVTIMAVSIVNLIVLARWLGPANVGEYFLLIRLVAVLTILGDLGLKQSANVYSGHHEEWTSRINRILLRFTFLSWALISIIGAGVIRLAGETLLPNFPQKWIWLAFAILPLSLYANFWNGMMIGRGQIWWLNLVQLVTAAASLGLTVLFIVGLSGGVFAAVMIYLATTIVQIVMMLVMAPRTAATSNLEGVPANLSTEMLSFGLRAYAGAISNLVWWNSAVFLLNAFHGTVAVGIFSIAQQLVEKLLVPIQAMQDAIFKKISVLPRHAAVIAMNRYVRVAFWAMVISMLVGVVLATWVITFFLGEAYLRTSHVCRVLLPGSAAISIPFLLAVYFLSQTRRPGLLSILAWVNALVNLILSLLLIPRFAEMGAAVALTLSQFLGTATTIIVYLRATETRLGQLIFVAKSDLRITRQQMGAILSGKRIENE